MPSLGADMDAGTLAEWRKKPGDPVKRGDIIAAVETAKGVIDIECFDDGVLDQVFFQAGQEVPVGQVLATIVPPGEFGKAKSAPAPAAPAPQKPAEPPKAEPAPAPAVPAPQKPAEQKPATQAPASDGRARISPLASRMAIEMGVDLRQVKGTGPGGAIQKRDIEAAAAAQKGAPAAAPAPAKAPAAPAPAAAEAAPAAGKPDFQTAMRGAIAAAMSKSNRDIPHYYMETRIDMTKALALAGGGEQQAHHPRPPAARRGHAQSRCQDPDGVP